MRKKIICVIPARYGSERLPGKVLYKIDGKTILQRVYERAKKVGIFSQIYIATEIVFYISFVILSILMINIYGIIGVTIGYAINYLIYLLLMLILFKNYLSYT